MTQPLSARPIAIANWLFGVAAFVFVMLVVGGITRLTESGLSITRWDLVTGTLPPLSDAAWQQQFDLYRQTPEFTQINGPAGMGLAEFKFIFFWEWFHRLIARSIGLAFALPLAWFWLRGAIPPGYKGRLVALLALGGLQGAVGWLMVQSGLPEDMTDVSHFRLSAHLLIALFTLAGLVWTALDLRELAKTGANKPARLTPLAMGVGAVIFVQLLLGAWVAGLNAGLASDTWPLMQGRIVPEADWSKGALWTFTHEHFFIHFLHRWWALAAVLAVTVLARADRRLGHRKISVVMHSIVGVQFLLGIWTVLSGVSLWIAVAHQLVGATLVAAVAWGAHVTGRRA